MSPVEIGDLIRRLRKERGLRLEDLADENISPATISNIERGMAHVQRVKVEYLLQKLDVSPEQAKELIQGEKRNLQLLNQRLCVAESFIRMGEAKKALSLLKLCRMNHPITKARVHHLKGKAYGLLKQWPKMEREYQEAIRCGQKMEQPEWVAKSYNQLGLIAFHQNDLHEALKQTDKGLQSLSENTEPSDIRYLLYRNKVIYLERLDQVGQALQVVNEIWPEVHRIQELDTVLSLYWAKSELLRRSKMWDKAFETAEEGLKLARLNRAYVSLFDLATVLGSISMEQKEWEWALLYFDLALGLKEHVSNPKVITTVYTRMGQLHIEREEWMEAQTSLEKAIQHGEKHHDVPRVTDTLITMGTLFYRKGDGSKGIPYLNRAVSMAEKHGLMEKLRDALYNLSHLLANTDQEAFTQTVIRFYEVQRELGQKEAPRIESIF